jgi:hypothetical protein
LAHPAPLCVSPSDPLFQSQGLPAAELAGKSIVGVGYAGRIDEYIGQLSSKNYVLLETQHFLLHYVVCTDVAARYNWLRGQTFRT